MIPKEITDTIKWEQYPKTPAGGQHCGFITGGKTLIHDDTGFLISASFRSQIKSMEFCLTVFELYLQEQKII